MQVLREQQAQRNAWSSAGIPSRFQDWTLDSSPVEEPVKARLAGSGNGQAWLLWGHHGVGKTGLAIGWLRQRIEETGAGRFVTLSDLLSELRNSYGVKGGSEAAVLEVYREVAVLALDDLGAEHVKDMDWLRDILYQIVGYRHDNLLPTVFTTNLSPQALADRIGERVMWRITEMCEPDGIVEVRGRNLRERKAEG